MRRSTRRRTVRGACLAAFLAATFAGCGLDVTAPDLFAVTRTGQGRPLTMVVNYDGNLTCNGRAAGILPDKLLLAARSLPGQLESDAQRKIDPPSPPRSVYRFKVDVQYGNFSFPDTSAAHRPELAKLEQVVLEAAPMCGS
jgi:hypothetical protein